MSASTTSFFRLDPNLRSLVYGVGVAVGTDDDWNYMWNSYLRSSNANEGGLYLAALSASQNTDILSRFLFVIAARVPGN